MRKFYYQLSFITVLIFSSFLLFTPRTTHALSGNDFQPGRIIDDTIFFNQQTMSAAQIQEFLNAKVPLCDTNGTQNSSHWYGAQNRYYTRAEWGAANGYSAPYICLKDYRQNTGAKDFESGLCEALPATTNTSAASIIYNVSQACRVSPKALIVLLQKEQALVTDDWPWSYEYRSATGFGCPDTAPCDSQFYGFFNQVYNAARQFRRYGRDESQFRYRAYRDNYIQYNPNTGCGGTNVYIQNQATAGLYNYTPYQPNASALANLYGTGDSCGAYGNRNFWRMWNDWFGSTYGIARDAIIESSSKTSGWLEYGETRTVSVAVRNMGAETWCSDGHCPAGTAPTRLVSQNYAPLWLYDPSDPAWINPAQVKMQTASVPQGQIGYFTFRLKAPYTKMAVSNRFFVLISGNTFAEAANVWIGGTTYAPPMQVTLKTVANTTILPNQEVLTTVKIRNQSKSTWYSDAGRGPTNRPLRLQTPGYARSPFYNATDPAWLTSSQIAMQTPVVNPGQEAIFQFKIRGQFKYLQNYTFSLIPVLDGLTILPDIGITYTLTNSNPILTYSFVSAVPPPPIMNASTTSPQKVTVTLKNTGNIVWRNESAGPFNRTRLYMIFPRYRSSPFYDATDPAWLTSSQIAMQTPVVNPGQNGVFEFKWKAPSILGNYLEYFSLVEDGYGFFPDYGSAFRTVVN